MPQRRASYIADAARGMGGRLYHLVLVMKAVVVKELMVPELVIEIEADAIVDSENLHHGLVSGWPFHASKSRDVS